MGMKHTVLSDGQPPIVAFNVLAQLCDSKANATEMGAALLATNSEGRNFDFFYFFSIHNSLIALVFSYSHSFAA